MDISARTMYGLRALLTLASARSDAPMSIQAIAEEEHLPHKFLEGIMCDLKRGGFVQSRRGASGGYMLNRPASEITLFEIICHLDGPITAKHYAEGPDGGSITPRQAAFSPVWGEIQEATVRVLETYTIQSVADAVSEPTRDGFTPNYQI